MAEYEGKSEDDNCGHCKFWKDGGLDDKVGEGWCTKRPRLNQKYDDRTHRTNWCQHYERAKMSEYEDKAHRSITKANRAEEQMNQPNKITEQAGQAAPLPATGRVIAKELQSFLKELTQMEQQLAQQMVNAAAQDNNLALMETKGMLRLAVMIRQNVEKRIEVLFPTDGEAQ